MNKKLSLANNEHIELLIAFLDIEEAIDDGDEDKAITLCQKWADKVRYSDIISEYKLMDE